MQEQTVEYLQRFGESGDIGMKVSIGVLQHTPLLPEAVQGST